MSDKIRTFKKAENKSASPKIIKNIGIDSSQKDIDKFLKERYGYGIWNFTYSFYWVAIFYNFRDMSKEVDLLRAKIKKLQSAKSRLIENIDQFLIDTDIWEIIKRSHPDLIKKWTTDKRRKFIEANFNVDRFFQIVSGYIERIKKRSRFLELYTKIPAERLRITPRNLIILVWSYVMRKGDDEEEIKFENISALLNWFSINKNWASMFKSTGSVSLKTPELTYNKYIKFAKDEGHQNLSNYIYVICFPDIADPLINMFPDPYDLIKLEIENKKLMTEKEFKKIIKKSVF
jgi:hypothetical protein